VHPAKNLTKDGHQPYLTSNVAFYDNSKLFVHFVYTTGTNEYRCGYANDTKLVTPALGTN
jgi:hypothetical protein